MIGLRTLTARILQQATNNGTVSNLPSRVCLTAQMSSLPTSPKSSDVAYPKADGKVKRESIRSKLASLIGGYVEPADPKASPIPSEEANFPDLVESATGEEKLLLLAFENGIMDPYCNLPVERNGRGSKDKPVIVESFFDERLVACACEPSQNSHRYMVMTKGEPKRCQCGHWIELVDAPRFWEKIPKEDLVEVEFFRRLEAEGKLDRFLETGKLEEKEHAHH